MFVFNPVRRFIYLFFVYRYVTKRARLTLYYSVRIYLDVLFADGMFTDIFLSLPGKRSRGSATFRAPDLKIRQVRVWFEFSCVVYERHTLNEC